MMTAPAMPPSSEMPPLQIASIWPTLSNSEKWAIT